MIRNLSRIAAAAGVATALLVVAPGSANAGEGEYATLNVTKTVVGTAPADAEFTIEVNCVLFSEDTTPAGGPIVLTPPFTETLTFDATGGRQYVNIGRPSICTVTETDNGGADSSSGPVQVMIEQPVPYDAEITNTFDDVAPTSESTSTSQDVAATTATPTFTG